MASNKSSSGKGSKINIIKFSEAKEKLTSISSVPEAQRFALLSSLFLDVVSSVEENETKVVALDKNADQLRSLTARAVLSHGHLETKARDLQRQSKLAKEENELLVREEEDKRRSVNSKLTSTMAEINALMRQNHDKNQEINQDNSQMESKLAELTGQYKAREEHMNVILAQKKLQLELVEAKFAKSCLEVQQDRESSLREKKNMIKVLQAYQNRSIELTDTELNLRKQLEKFASQYKNFHETIETSNVIMKKLETEIKTMSTRIGGLEKRTVQWQHAHQNSHRCLLQLAAERADLLTQSEGLSKQNIALQSLSRSLQGRLVERRNKMAAEAKMKELEERGADLPGKTAGEEKKKDAKKQGEADGEKSGEDIEKQANDQMKLMQSIQSRLDDLKMQVGTKNEDTLQTLQETEDKINKQITEL